MIASVMTICVMVNPRCCLVVLLLGFIYAPTSETGQSRSNLGKHCSGANYVEIPGFVKVETGGVLLMVTAVGSQIPITTDYRDV